MFADKTRRQILLNLRHSEQSVTDLAQILNKSHSSIQHHLKLLKDAGLVEETRLEKKRNLVQPYYRAVAKKILISYSLSDSLNVPALQAWQKETQNKILSELQVFGISLPETAKERVRKLLMVCYLQEQKALEETIEQQNRPLELEKPVYSAIIQLLTQIKLSRDEEHKNAIAELETLFKTPPKNHGK
ncbi:MAG: metalloregulator ArsR/SmtB family transcription factor [Candidatus Bathyarchaeota archaeon]